jgi:hypothetical protein
MLSYLLTVPSGWNWLEHREPWARLQNGTNALTSMHNCIRLEGLTFRAVLSEGVERLELARV